MSDISIVNCHIHTFHSGHVPKNYPYRALRPFKSSPALLRGLARCARFVGQYPVADKLERLYQFQKESAAGSQKKILQNVLRHYPTGTRFVVLPMDLSAFGYGAPDLPLSEQHDELSDLTGDPEVGASVIPFATIDPRADPEAREMWRAIDRLAFRGVKLYPRLGFAPDDERLMRHVYPGLEQRGLPVMTHCSRGGVQGRYLPDYTADRYCEPYAFIPVMRAHPRLRICLAHFGGQRDWAAYVNPDQHDKWGEEYSRNWQVMIRRMIGSGEYPGLWTDISYALFRFEEFVPFLRLFLMGEEPEDDLLRARVLFGSDFYMTRQQRLSEKAVCFMLRNALGEEVFRQIAEINPRVWLGETPADPGGV